MSSRHLSRTIVLQSLYVWDFHGCSREVLKKALRYNIQQFAGGLVDLSFVKALISSILKNQRAIDDLIKKYAALWPLDKLTLIDRNVLRIAIAELNYFSNVPQKAAIDQAIELAKNFGGESSAKFISGVLGTYFDDLHRPKIINNEQ